MRSISWIRFVRTGALAALLAGAAASGAAAKPGPVRPTRPRSINLFASSGLLFQTNRQLCGLQSDGQTCVAFSGSPVGGGGFWPKGTPDQYIFNSGLQIGVVVDPNAAFAWAGDTTGAYFFDARGDQLSGEGLTGWYNALDPADATAWPNGAVVRDASDSIYNALLVGQKTISQGDAWVRYWEGNPDLGPRNGPGQHPAGILVDQRALAWNFPSGNEDIIYFVFTFYNVTARSSSGAYNNPSIPPELQAEIGAVGDRFQDINEQKFKIDIPDGGYNLTSIYAGFGMDADVAVFSQNYGTAFLPFNIGSIYTGTFLPEVGWQFPPDIFGPPFAAAPGFIGVKYLKSPTNAQGQQVGLTMFSMTTNGSPHRDPVGVNQLYRYLSGFLGSTDDACSPFTDPAVARERRLCYLATQQSDARFFQASGPFNLAPGHASSIVVAYINAAPVNAPGLAIGGNLVPGVPASGDSIFADTNKVRLIDRVAGWVTQQDKNSDQVIEQDEVTTVPRSLLNKALIAQTVFDNGFLLPNAPKAPPFYLVPGDNQVTVVWQKSESETEGDPFFAAASDATSALYDPNFRQFDVEGYRIYRGRTANDLQLVAQYDYSGTSFVDYTGAIDYGDLNGDGKVECAPELGLEADCPTPFDMAPPFTQSFETDLSGDVVQIPPGGRVELASGGTINLKADTAVTGEGSGFPGLNNSGVPFAFVDRSVRNSFTYFYSVTAFDVNSVKSGPTSLESPRVTKSVTPRKSAANLAEAQLVTGISGDDGQLLDPSASFAIDPNTGRFQNPPPPTDGIEGLFAPLVQQLLPAVNLAGTVDSVVPHDEFDFDCGSALNGLGSCYTIYVTLDKDGNKQSFSSLVWWPVWDAFDGVTSTQSQLAALAIPADQASADRFGIPSGFAQFNATVSATFRQYIDFSDFEGQASRRNLFGNGAGVSPGGSRWFDGANETVDNPTVGIRVGHVAGVDSIWAPIHHTDTDPATAGVQSYASSGAMQCFGYVLGGLGREADVEFTWGANGQMASVRDVTHHVDVQYKPVPQATYGFIGDANGDGVISWDDFQYLETASQGAEDLGFCGHTDPGPGNRAQLAQQPIIMDVSTAGDPQTSPPVTGTGFGLYIDGERYIFQLTGGQAPASGTKWTLRTYAGYVSAANGAGGLTPTGYRFSPKIRSPGIPGLQVKFTVAAATSVATETAQTLERVHTVPDPYYVTDALETTANSKVLKFVNLPPQAIIRIYSLGGVLVNLITHDDPGLGGEETWNLRNRNNQFVASGVYFYQIETPAGHTKVGRFTIVNFAP